jgi:hypothetical protein
MLRLSRGFERSARSEGERLSPSECNWRHVEGQANRPGGVF